LKAFYYKIVLLGCGNMIYTKARYDNKESIREIENRTVSYLAATEGVVLLHNEGVLPLKSKKIALFGPGALMTIKGGTGSGEVKERRVISVLEGMLDRG
jgi:beta-glucosidase